MIFAISGFYAGIAGALLASLLFYVSPQTMNWTTSGDVLIMSILGGVGTLFGPVVGAMLLQALTAWAGTLPDINPNLILGLVLVVAVLVIPRGLQPTLADLLRRREAP